MLLKKNTIFVIGMSEKKGNKSKLIERLRHPYRLVVMNDDTFEENFSLRLTPLGLVILIGSITIVMTMIVTSLIAFTPLREYIPGYADVNMRRELVNLSKRSDSLEQSLIKQNLFTENINNVLRGNIKSDSAQNRPDKSKETSKLKMNASQREEALKKTIEAQDQYSLAFESEGTKNGISNFFFFTPIKGIVSTSFKASEQHFGVDIVGPENEAIKTTLDGTVILATWSSETGYTITVQHSNNLISVYKHNSVLLKKVGDYVKAGEPIAIIGNSGEQTTGPHLHFELWYNGNPINPQDYMVF
jgi:murein DD-endopeptidase MepM/ murein hydrolase activator NlpD